ncbi:MAG TPA: LURP-one-related family protein [Tepidisphaeraceae bacterium]|nr:LURP-one-related family protein [Tepidisphaeraceae bacterium]
MRYVMKEKLWSWADDFTIRDEAGADQFVVRGRVFSLGDKLSFTDLAGQELVFIRQKLLSWGPTYELERGGGGAPTAVVRKHLWTFFKDRFTVDVTADGATPDDLEVRGDFWDHEYEFVRTDGRSAARVSKQWFSWADTYGVDVAPGEDDVLILACTVVVDQVMEKRRR